MMRFLWFLFLLPRNVAIALMKAYRRLISPLYGQVCRYHPSCSRYALEVYQNQGFLRGTMFTGWRLLRCNPWSSGGIDDPPGLTNERVMINRHGYVVLRGPSDADGAPTEEQSVKHMKNGIV